MRTRARRVHERAQARTPASVAGALILGSLLACAPAETPEPPAVEPEETAPIAASDELGLRANRAGAFEGYMIFSPIRSRTIYLLDRSGEVVHRWEGENGLGSPVYLLDDGNILFSYRVEENPVFHGGGIGGRLIEMTWDGEVVWEYLLSSEERIQHHDLERLPNGNVLAIVWERVSPDEAVANGRDPLQVSESGLWPCAVLEIEPVRPRGGKVVWEWRSWDHVVQDRRPGLLSYGDLAAEAGKLDINADHRYRVMSPEEIARRQEVEAQMRAVGYIGGEAGGEQEASPAEDGPPRRRNPDWLHLNSVDYHAELDLIVVSSPSLSEIFVIDHSITTAEAAGPAGDLLYRWGNPRNYAAGGDAERRLYEQHDAQWIAPGYPGAGNVLVFNNGPRRPDGDYSSVDEIVLPLTGRRFARAEGEPFGPADPAWSYADPEGFYSWFISGSERLPTGNTRICAGVQGRLFEVTPEGEVVWDYWNPFGGEIPASIGRGPVQADFLPQGAVFRTTQVPPDHPGLRRLAPSGE